MSKFFGGSDDSETSDSENESQASEAHERVAPPQPSRFDFESSDDEEEKRVVRSFKDKRFDALRNVIKKIRNNMKVHDWFGIMGNFELLNSELKKSKKLTDAEGIPKFYFHIMLALERLHENDRMSFKGASGKKQNKNNQKAYNTMNQRLRKHRQQYEKEYALAEAHPEDSEADSPKKSKHIRKEHSQSDDSSTSSSSSDSDSPAEDDGDEEEADTFSDDSSDSGSDVDLSGGITRDFWVKKADKDESDSDDEEKRVEKDRVRKERAEKMKQEKEARRAEREAASKKDQAAQMTPEVVVKKLKEILSKFGRRTTDKQKLIEDLRLLNEKASDLASLLKIKTILMAALFDRTGHAADYMPVQNWKECQDNLLGIVDFLKEHQNVRLSEDDAVEETETQFPVPEDTNPEDHLTSMEIKQQEQEKKRADEEREVNKGKAVADRVQFVAGNLFSFLSRLNTEYIRSLQNMDSHAPEYIERLCDEPALVATIAKAQAYYHSIGKGLFESKCCLLRLEWLYYRYVPELDALSEGKEAPFKARNGMGQTQGLVGELASLLYANGDSRSRIRALLCHVYFLALHNRYAESRNLLLMSHVPDTIGQTDIETRILFNRAMAQLGLCAFRVGDIRQAMYSLVDFYTSNRVKELLAQGTSQQRWQDRDEDKEKLEKLRVFPYHMHLKLSILDAVHLISAMLLEVPNMASHGRRWPINKQFRRLVDHHSRQAFNGPPENTRDTVMAATKCMQQGEWLDCWDHLLKLDIWECTPRADIVKNIIKEQVQQTTLKVYLLNCGSQYTSIRMETLCKMFQLPETQIFAVVSGMIVKDQLAAAWDQPRSCLVMFSEEPNNLQKTALHFADKVGHFTDQNEKLLDARSGGGFGGSDAWAGKERTGGNRGGRGRGRSNRGRGARGGRTSHNSRDLSKKEAGGFQQNRTQYLFRNFRRSE